VPLQAAILTEEEKSKCRYHLGYLDVQAASSFSLGTPAMVQTQFMIEGAMNNLNMVAYPKFVQLLCRLDQVEAEVYCTLDLVQVNKVDSVEVNRNQMKELAARYKLAQQALAQMLGIVPQPFEQRSWLTGEDINVRVNH